MRTIDLFSGVGGLSLGFKSQDFKIIGAIDNWDKAVQTYNNNFNILGHKAISHDLTAYKEIDFNSNYGLIECVIGGPPCQDFSSAGKRIESQNANLTVVFAEIIKKISPKFFVMENVSRAKNSFSYLRAKKILKESGYKISELILNASFCGVPQSRKRFFSIGEKNGSVDNFMDNIISQSISKKPLTIREYFGDNLNINHYYRHPRSYQRRAIYSIDEPSATIRGVNRPIPKTYTPHSKDSVKDLEGIRSLTYKERAKVQTFPDEFIWDGTKTEIEQLIGNAVPPKLAGFVAHSLKKYIENGYYGDNQLSFI